jgi:hypothetical protein
METYEPNHFNSILPSALGLPGDLSRHFSSHPCMQHPPNYLILFDLITLIFCEEYSGGFSRRIWFHGVSANHEALHYGIFFSIWSLSPS